MAKKSRGGLVKKQVTVRRKGKTFKQTRMVSATGPGGRKNLSTARYLATGAIGSAIGFATHHAAIGFGKMAGAAFGNERLGAHIGNAVGGFTGLAAGARTADRLRQGYNRSANQRRVTIANRTLQLGAAAVGAHRSVQAYRKGGNWAHSY